MKMARCNPELGPPSYARLRSSGDYLREVDLMAQSKRIRTSRFGPWWPGPQTEELAMKKSRVKVMLVAAVGLLVSVGVATPTRAETGAVSVVFTKGGFIVGVGG